VAGCKANPLPPTSPAKESSQKVAPQFRGIEYGLLFFTLGMAGWSGVPTIYISKCTVMLI
jgi:hypothetical protein